MLLQLNKLVLSLALAQGPYIVVPQLENQGEGNASLESITQHSTTSSSVARKSPSEALRSELEKVREIFLAARFSEAGRKAKTVINTIVHDANLVLKASDYHALAELRVIEAMTQERLQNDEQEILASVRSALSFDPGYTSEPGLVSPGILKRIENERSHAKKVRVALIAPYNQNAILSLNGVEYRGDEASIEIAPGTYRVNAWLGSSPSEVFYVKTLSLYENSHETLSLPYILPSNSKVAQQIREAFTSSDPQEALRRLNLPSVPMDVVLIRGGQDTKSTDANGEFELFVGRIVGSNLNALKIQKLSQGLNAEDLEREIQNTRKDLTSSGTLSAEKVDAFWAASGAQGSGSRVGLWTGIGVGGALLIGAGAAATWYFVLRQPGETGRPVLDARALVP